MKTILLMSCALCAGMNGYGSTKTLTVAEMSILPESMNMGGGRATPKNGDEVSTLQKRSVSSPINDKKRSRTDLAAMSEPHQEGLDKDWQKRREAYGQIQNETKETLSPLLYSKAESDNSEIKKAIQDLLSQHPENKKLVYRCVRSRLDSALVSGNPPTEDTAEKILEILDGMSFDELFPTTSAEK